MATGTWRPGPPLPELLHYPAYLPYRDSFIVFGGFVEATKPSTDVWYYDYEDKEWDLIGQVCSKKALTRNSITTNNHVLLCCS